MARKLRIDKRSNMCPKPSILFFYFLCKCIELPQRQQEEEEEEEEEERKKERKKEDYK